MDLKIDRRHSGILIILMDPYGHFNEPSIKITFLSRKRKGLLSTTKSEQVHVPIRAHKIYLLSPANMLILATNQPESSISTGNQITNQSLFVGRNSMEREAGDKKDAHMPIKANLSEIIPYSKHSYGWWWTRDSVTKTCYRHIYAIYKLWRNSIEIVSATNAKADLQFLRDLGRKRLFNIVAITQRCSLAVVSLINNENHMVLAYSTNWSIWWSWNGCKLWVVERYSSQPDSWDDRYVSHNRLAAITHVCYLGCSWAGSWSTFDQRKRPLGNMATRQQSINFNLFAQ